MIVSVTCKLGIFWLKNNIVSFINNVDVTIFVKLKYFVNINTFGMVQITTGYRSLYLFLCKKGSDISY